MLQDRKHSSKPFENSLSALAQVAVFESGAKGFALFRKDLATSTFVRLVAEGVDIRVRDFSNPSGDILVHNLAPGGVLALAFESETRRHDGQLKLQRIFSVIQAVWKTAQESAEYSRLASRVGDLETRLMDSKIADRVRGLLTQFQDSSPVTPGAVEALGKHVEGVLRPPSAKRVLRQLTRELEEEVEKRRLTNRAKAILRSVHGMSEEEAYVHLQRTSRKSRRKLKDVAADLLEQQPFGLAAGSSL